MSKWVTESLEKLLHEINEVPYTDNREGQQLSLLMKGFAMINNQAMDKAAVKTRASMRNWDLDSATSSQSVSDNSNVDVSFDDTQYKDNEVDELTRLRPIR